MHTKYVLINIHNGLDQSEARIRGRWVGIPSDVERNIQLINIHMI